MGGLLKAAAVTFITEKDLGGGRLGIPNEPRLKRGLNKLEAIWDFIGTTIQKELENNQSLSAEDERAILDKLRAVIIDQARWGRERKNVTRLLNQPDQLLVVAQRDLSAYVDWPNQKSPDNILEFTQKEEDELTRE